MYSTIHHNEAYTFVPPFTRSLSPEQVGSAQHQYILPHPASTRTHTSALVIVLSSPGAAVCPVTALTAMSTAWPTLPRVAIQYRISSGITSMTATRGSFLSPL